MNGRGKGVCSVWNGGDLNVEFPLWKKEIWKDFLSLEVKIYVLGLSAEGRFRKRTSSNLLWPIRKASQCHRESLTSPKCRAWRKKSLSIKLIPLLCSKLITTNMLLQVHLFWHIIHLHKHLLLFEKRSCQEAQVLQC